MLSAVTELFWCQAGPAFERAVEGARLGEAEQVSNFADRVFRTTSPPKLPVPYHTFLKKDAMPLVPGQLAALKSGLQPISVLVKKGHRLRVAIAGHDKDTFIRIPAEGTPVIAVQRNSRGLSMIELPVIKR